jgi:hypothetical protein
VQNNDFTIRIKSEAISNLQISIDSMIVSPAFNALYE